VSERSLKHFSANVLNYQCFLKLSRLNYYPVKTLDEVVDVFTRETNDPAVDSVEGIMYSLNEGKWPSGLR
jgi:hypothetical protein